MREASTQSSAMRPTVEPESRRTFLRKFPLRAVLLGSLPRAIGDELKGMFLRPFAKEVPDDKKVLVPNPAADETQETLSELNTWQRRIQQYIAESYSGKMFPLPDSGLTVAPAHIEQNEDDGNLLFYADYAKPKYVTAKQVVNSGREGIPTNSLRELGVRASFTQILQAFIDRYQQLIDEGLLSTLAETIDPTTKNFFALTEKYATLTGLPTDVVRAIWWRENFGAGNAPTLHLGASLPSGDGPFAPNVHLYSMPVVPHGTTKYSSSGIRDSFQRIFRVQTGETIRTVALMGDARLRANRRNEAIIVTPVRKDLVQYDAELNILFGLMLYYQALEALVENPTIRRAADVAIREQPQLDIFDIGYSVYHHGPLPTELYLLDRLSELAGDQVGTETASYFVAPAKQFRNSRQSRSWNTPRYRTQSGYEEDPSDLEFFDLHPHLFVAWRALLEKSPEYQQLMTEFVAMYHQSDGWHSWNFPVKVSALGFLLLASNPDSIQFFETVLKTKTDWVVPDQNRMINSFISFFRQCQQLLQTSTWSFGSFEGVGNVSESENREALGQVSPMFNRLIECGYWLDQQAILYPLQELFKGLFGAVQPARETDQLPPLKDLTQLVEELSLNTDGDYEYFLETLAVVLSEERLPKFQPDYFREFAQENPQFMAKFEQYQNMREAFVGRGYSDLAFEIMLLSLIGADGSATQFTLESIERLFPDSPRLSEQAALMLAEFQSLAHRDNGFYHLVGASEQPQHFAEKMVKNPLYKHLKQRWDNEGYAYIEGPERLLSIIYGEVFPGWQGEFHPINRMPHTADEITQTIQEYLVRFGTTDK